MNIHPTAIIDPKAELADDVEVQAFSIVGPHVRI
ncbi:MAG: acyl-[acyl-carrier-protein]--UDP-N-acetylglucosamine O-acyltransferase, partial [Candidatus Hydrogenedentes bacterium]|nr:acyl-[acyl-carrier-protein]--UDP-N-acetylglucosamine O-acyltransferase [Candidatus Hydrogenedentota bacterium]